VDFIYVFPQGRDHYGLVPPGFVIRPHGDTWSQDPAADAALLGEWPMGMIKIYPSNTFEHMQIMNHYKFIRPYMDIFGHTHQSLCLLFDALQCSC
jgi:hypothetical protein